MSEVFELQAQIREVSGKAHSRRMRREDNKVPAIIYGAGKDNISITLEANKVRTALGHEAFYSQILTINIDKKKEKAVIKAIQRHPYKEEILHMDFLRIDANAKLTMNVPVHFLNEEEAPGIKAGGVATHHATEIEVSCLPADLPAHIDVDLKAVEMDQVVHISHITLPKGVESVALNLGEEHDFALVGIHEPRVQEEPEEVVEETEGEEAAAAEGEEGAEKAEGDKTDDKEASSKEDKKDEKKS